MRPDAAPESREALLRRIAVLESENQRLRAGGATDTRADEFLAVVSHELRTPIHVMMGFLRILQRGLGGPLTEAQQGYLDKAMGVAEVLSRLVNDILDMSQVRAGAFRVQPEPCDARSLIRDCVSDMRPLAAQKGVELVMDVPEDLPAVRADLARLGQVLINLVSNGIKFTPAGGRVTVSARVDAQAFHLSVRDTGVGIPPTELPRLFQPFTQLDMSLTRQVGGAGIGLSISKAIVEAHGGSIGVTSQTGEGSTFYFTLPGRSEREPMK